MSNITLESLEPLLAIILLDLRFFKAWTIKHASGWQNLYKISTSLNSNTWIDCCSTKKLISRIVPPIWACYCTKEMRLGTVESGIENLRGLLLMRLLSLILEEPRQLVQNLQEASLLLNSAVRFSYGELYILQMLWQAT